LGRWQLLNVIWDCGNPEFFSEQSRWILQSNPTHRALTITSYKINIQSAPHYYMQPTKQLIFENKYLSHRMQRREIKYVTVIHTKICSIASYAEIESQGFSKYICLTFFIYQTKYSNYFKILLEETQSPWPYIKTDTISHWCDFGSMNSVTILLNSLLILSCKIFYSSEIARFKLHY